MGKIRTRFIGIEEIEEQQKKEQKEKASKKRIVKTDVEGENKNIETSRKEDNSKKVTKKTKQRGSKYQKAKAKIDQNKEYSLQDAVELLKKVSFAGFDESVELHVNVESEGMRGEVSLPHSTGKVKKVAVLDDKILKDIESGEINFDILIATPAQMPKLAKYARILGPKGLMPNPKAGTISSEPNEVAKKFEKGAIRWKSESKMPIIHQTISKLSAETKDIVENAQAFIDSVGSKKIKTVFISATMTPSVRIALQ